MKTTWGRRFLLLAVAMSVIIPLWGWKRPYDGDADPTARMKVAGVDLRGDHSFCWLECHVRMKRGECMDLSRPVRLVLDERRELMPADTRLSGSQDEGLQEAWFKFWLEQTDLPCRMTLVVSGESLRIKSTAAVPRVASGATRHYTSHRW